ncbi:pantoate-beta-alanine ligase [Kwoniella newhampshirensis]|uniref:Pantoate--beta-alanine ligase n=1 Tax=Kwoniella newhampshirensis TaxID=1651941 RepID=A0AAW0YSX9_9TREE
MIIPFRPCLSTSAPFSPFRPIPGSSTSISLDVPIKRGMGSIAAPRIPVIRTLPQLRRWRQEARERKLEVGVVPTMGALHEGHLNLVRASMTRHPLTVMTLFVNPMQFAPTEDLSSYPRQLDRDLSLLSTTLPSLSTSSSSSTNPSRSVRGLGISEHESFRPNPPQSPTAVESPLVVFAPSPEVMYPLKGELQDLGRHKGVSVDVKGWAEVMEGASRPQFFKGVATVCTKLFNAVEPDHAYFGQKDIQQALLLKIMVQDLLLSHPTSSNLHILPTTRAPSGLALSSRNAYLSKFELLVAPVLHRALSSAVDLYNSTTTSLSNEENQVTGEDLVASATRAILDEQERLLSASEDDGGGVELRLDYVEVFDKHTFEPVRGKVGTGREMVVAGAVWVGTTRLIDNLLIGWEVD